MSGRRVLVTGVGGFVGAYLAQRISARGDVALGLGIEPPSSPVSERLSGYWTADIVDGKALGAALREAAPDAIVHLAGQSSAGLSFDRPVETFHANAVGTWNLLEAVRAVTPGARVLVVGSADVYGPQPQGSRVAESASLRPISPYGLSKAVAETTALHYARALDLDVVCTRSFPHVGAGQGDRFVIPSVARQIAAIESAGDAVVRVGNLEVVRDLTTVDSVAAAYLALLDRGHRGAVYNVCSGVPVALSALVKRLVGRSRRDMRIEIDPEKMRPADLPYLVGDPTAIGRDSGWSAAPLTDEFLDEILDEWRARLRSAPAR